MSTRALALALTLALPRADGLASPTPRPLPGLSRRAKPLAWFHVPKTGSSLVNALFHTPVLCPAVPKDFAVDLDHCKPGNVMHCHERHGINISRVCPHAFSKWGEHLGVGVDFERQYKGHGISILRQPEQRMLSHMHMEATSPNLALHLGFDDFKEKFQGCAVKMLVRNGWMSNTCGGAPPSQEEVDEAVARINAFVFVGVVEKWDLSMCLFRKMFGGGCVGSDFLNARPGTMYDDKGSHEIDELEGESMFKDYPTDQFNGWYDHADHQLYNATSKKFEQLMQAHGVSEESCKPCFEQMKRAWAPQDL